MSTLEMVNIIALDDFLEYDSITINFYEQYFKICLVTGKSRKINVFVKTTS